MCFWLREIKQNGGWGGWVLLFHDRLMIGLVAPLWRRENPWESSGGVMFCPLILFPGVYICQLQRHG